MRDTRDPAWRGDINATRVVRVRIPDDGELAADERAGCLEVVVLEEGLGLLLKHCCKNVVGFWLGAAALRGLRMEGESGIHAPMPPPLVLPKLLGGVARALASSGVIGDVGDNSDGSFLLGPNP